MQLHHLGYVGADLARLQRRFAAESFAALTDAIADPVQRVYVQFYVDRITGAVCEIIAPLGTVAESPLSARIRAGGGLDHACYELEAGDGDLESVIALEVAAGARVVCPPVMATAFGRRIAFVFRRSERLIEYVEARVPGAVI